ncbi:MAG: MFS transporter [Thermodesulfovibrio sp.]|nr:MFS transporter [Thermodesulfovibrio sp.]
MEYQPKNTGMHYGWVIVFTGMLSICACLGFGRFAIGMLLPSMAVTLKLTYAQMGFISTANFIGYLASVLISGHWSSEIGARRLIFLSLLLVGISMALVSQAASFQQVLFLYMVTGIGSGAANVTVMGLVSAWFSNTRRGRAAGFIVIGSGFAIIISGRLIPFVNSLQGPEGWRTNWMILSTIVIAIACLSVLLIRNRPEDKGLQPLGAETGGPGKPARPRRQTGSVYREKMIYFLGLIYFLFGYTYVIYATFIVTTLVRERGFSESLAGNFWSMVGFLSLFSGPVFGTLSDRLSRKAGLIIVFTFQMISYLLVASGLPGIFLYLSIFFFGIVAWSIPSIMAAAVGDYVGAQKAAKAFGLVTFIFGFGQIAGPAVAGLLAEKTGSFSSSFIMAAAAAGIAIVLTSFLKKPGSDSGKT